MRHQLQAGHVVDRGYRRGQLFRIWFPSVFGLVPLPSEVGAYTKDIASGQGQIEASAVHGIRANLLPVLHGNATVRRKPVSRVPELTRLHRAPVLDNHSNINETSSGTYYLTKRALSTKKPAEPRLRISLKRSVRMQQK